MKFAFEETIALSFEAEKLLSLSLSESDFSDALSPIIIASMMAWPPLDGFTRLGSRMTSRRMSFGSSLSSSAAFSVSGYILRAPIIYGSAGMGTLWSRLVGSEISLGSFELYF